MEATKQKNCSNITAGTQVRSVRGKHGGNIHLDTTLFHAVVPGLKLAPDVGVSGSILENRKWKRILRQHFMKAQLAFVGHKSNVSGITVSLKAN